VWVEDKGPRRQGSRATVGPAVARGTSTKRSCLFECWSFALRHTVIQLPVRENGGMYEAFRIEVGRKGAASTMRTNSCLLSQPVACIVFSSLLLLLRGEGLMNPTPSCFTEPSSFQSSLPADTLSHRTLEFFHSKALIQTTQSRSPRVLALSCRALQWQCGLEAIRWRA
jgi:hypothetical protein